MPQTALPNLALNYDWELGRDGWKAGMDNNLALLDNLAQAYITVDPKSVTAQPGSPANGAAYILASTHTGAAWAARSENDIAIYYTNTGWHFATPKEGWVVRDQANNRYLYFDGTNWVGLRGEPISVTGAGTTNPTIFQANHLFLLNNASKTFNIPLNSAVAYPLGTKLTVVNLNATTAIISDTAGVSWDFGDPTAFSPQLVQQGLAEFTKTATNQWMVTRWEVLP